MSDSANDTPVEDKLSALQIDRDAEGGEDEEELSQAVVNRLVALKQFQNDVEQIDVEYKKERAALEKKFELLRAPILEKRRDVVSGELEVELETDSVPEPEPENEENKEVGIPGFWYQCIANHPALSSLLSEEDLGPLEALSNISCEYNEDYSGFKLTFAFRENDFFTNTELHKSYTVSPDLLEEKAPALTSVEGTKIDWKHKKNLCMTEVKKKQKAKSGRKAGQIRYVTKMEAKQSFFHFFSDPRIDDNDEDEEEGGLKEGEHEFQLSVDEDYEAGHAFRAEIIPDAILWFTGEALDDEDDEDDEDYLAGEDDEDDDEEDDDDDDEEDGPSSTSVPAGGQTGEQPECKQS